jgi:hypothetical protein
VSERQRELTNVTTQDVFDLFLLKATFDDQVPVPVHTTTRSQFGKQELDHVFRLPMHFFTDLGYVRPDGPLVTFSMD